MGSLSRRIVIESGISIVFTLDISRISAPMSTNFHALKHSLSLPPSTIRFIGANSSAIKSLHEKYYKYINSPSLSSNPCANRNTISLKKEQPLHWRHDLSIYQNFSRVFGPLPSPATTSKSDYVVECGICYCHRLPLSSKETSPVPAQNNYQCPSEQFILPDESCGNPKCGRSYHQSCLYDWLNSLSSSRVNFDRIFGTCPYCSEPLSVKVNFEV